MERPGTFSRGAAVLFGAAAWAIAPAVAAAAWSAPQDLVPTSGLEAHQALAIDARGTAIALLGFGDPLRYAEQSATEPWAAPRSLGAGGAARLVETPAETLVVWPRRIGDDSHVVTASRTLEGVWSVPTEIGSVSSRYLRAVSLSADTLGGAVAGLVETNDPANPSAVLARAPGGAWSPLDLGPVPSWARVIVGDSGAMTAVWREDSSDQNAGRGRLKLAERAAGGGFVEVPSPFGEPALALRDFSGTPAGDAMLVANAETGTATVWLRPAGGAFGSPRVLRGEFAGAGDSSMGSDGTAALVWRVRGEIRALVRAPGGDFGAPVTIPAPAPDGAVTGPLVSVGPDGTIVAAWSSLRSTGPRRRVAGTVWASVRRPGGAFGRAVVVNDRSLPASLQKVAAGEGGVAVITWGESTGGGFVLQAARNEPRPLITRLTATSPAGGATVRLRLAEPASVTAVLTRAAGRVLARRTLSLPAGTSRVTLAAPGTLAGGRHRIRVSARSANRSAGADVHVRAAPTP